MCKMQDIEKALDELLGANLFKIDEILHEEKSFGNVLILLKSNRNVNIRFIKDKGDFWCEIGTAREWYFIEDVFVAIGINSDTRKIKFLSMIANKCKEIKKNSEIIFTAFDAEHSRATSDRIKKIASNRAMELLNTVVNRD